MTAMLDNSSPRGVHGDMGGASIGAREEVLQKEIQCLTEAVRAAFREVVVSPNLKGLRSVSQRMKRAALVESFFAAHALLTQHKMVHGGVFVDPRVALKAICADVLTTYCHAFSLGDTTHLVADQYRLLRAVIAEAKVMFQALNASFGPNYIHEEIEALITSQIATIENYGMQQIIVSYALEALPALRLLDRASSAERAALLDDIQSCIRFGMMLIPRIARKGMMVSLVRDPFMAAARDKNVAECHALVRNCPDYAALGDGGPLQFLREVNNILARECSIIKEVLTDDHDAPAALKTDLQKAIFSSVEVARYVQHTKETAVAAAMEAGQPETLGLLFEIWECDSDAIKAFTADFKLWTIGSIEQVVASSAESTQKHAGVVALAKRVDAICQLLCRALPLTGRHVLMAELHDAVSTRVDTIMLAGGLVHAVDGLIRRAAPASSTSDGVDAALLSELDRFIALIPLCRHGTLFTECYKQKLLTRHLMMPRAPSTALEWFVLRRIAHSRGAPSGFHEAAIVLMELRSASTSQLAQQRDDGQPPSSAPRVSTTLISSLVSPVPSGDELQPGDILLPPLREAILSVGAAKPMNVAREMDLWLSTAEMRLHHAATASSCRIFGSVPQLQVLMWLMASVEACSDGVTMEAIVANCGLTPLSTHAIVNALLHLGAVIKEGKKFVVDANFVCARNGKKVALAPFSFGEHNFLRQAPPLQSAPTAPAKPLLTINEVTAEANAKKDLGNGLFAKGQFSEAVEVWQSGIDVIERVRVNLPDVSLKWYPEVTQVKAAILTNLMMGLLRLGRPLEVIHLASEQLSNSDLPEPLRVKTMYRRALAYADCGKYDLALMDLRSPLLSASSDLVIMAKRKEIESKMKQQAQQ